MLKNIRLEISYDGTRFHGWQVQLDKRGREKEGIRTVQGEIEKAIERIFNLRVRIVYSGRTDKGVHAKAQTANFKVDTNISLNSIKEALNTYLPEDIRVRKAEFVSLDFHSRFSAKSKLYRYVILNRKEPDVFLRNYSWQVTDKLDVRMMKRAAILLKGEKDFSSFTRKASLYKSCVRKVKRVSVKKSGRFIYIDVESEGFLWGMARNMVSLIVSAGLNRIDINGVLRIIKDKDRSLLGRPAPAAGLFLKKVFY